MSLFVVCFTAGLALLLAFSYQNTVVVPAAGGELREGIVGSPRFVNPVLALTRADQDMVELLYDGLMTQNEAGELVPHIAESVTISDDGLTYNILLRQDIFFHDGVKLTADDVIFTVGLIQDANLKSPLRGNFDGVSIERLGDYEVNFVLQEPYVPFIDNLTVGILPRHEWSELTSDQIPFSQHNTEPIGSGPYRIKEVVRNQAGLIDGYILEAFADHIRRPNIKTVVVSFFPNDESLANALKDGTVDSAIGLGTSRDDIVAARPELTTVVTPLPRTFGVFFNQNKSAALREPEVREALNLVIDRDALVAEALPGEAVPIDTVLPPGFGDHIPRPTTTRDTLEDKDARIAAAVDVLEREGWKRNPEGIWSKTVDGGSVTLSVDIATANLPFLAATAEYLKTQWTALGVNVSVRQFEQVDLTQTVIRTRDYEALLFGTTVGRTLDFYPYWHSSQRNDPGLNIALYANITADAALEKSRTTTNPEERTQALVDFLTEFERDTPALFLFVPTITQIIPEQLIMNPITKLTSPHERFVHVESWYIKTESVWPFFTN